MRAFLPLPPVAISQYLERMLFAVGSVNPASEGYHYVQECVALAEGDPEAIQEAPTSFWMNVKAGIEFMIDYMVFDAPPYKFDPSLLDRAFADLHRLVDWLQLVTGRRFEPELMNGTD